MCLFFSFILLLCWGHIFPIKNVYTTIDYNEDIKKEYQENAFRIGETLDKK